VAIARAQLADPEWVKKAKEGREIITCLDCKRCQWFTDGKKCPRNINYYR
jgi:2,4-dienoyl-CoA reductase-like NADH-dependent reductase (Old Yellow Enzyme family)